MSQLAEQAGVALRTIENVEPTGRSSLETCKYLANAFGIDLGKLTRLRDVDTEDSSAVSTTEGISEYLNRLRDTLGARLAPLVELRALDKDSSLTQTVEKALSAGRNALVLGPSGSGKSHAVFHVALRLCSGPMVPIVAQAGHFRGDFSQMIESAVSPYTLCSFDGLRAAAQPVGKSLVLILDGFNECTPSLCQDLVDGIQALLLRVPTLRLVITAQSGPSLPPAIRGDRIEVATCDSRERIAILRAHGLEIGDSEKIAAVVKAISSPFDLALAAKCWSNLPLETTRYHLIHAFVCKALEQAQLDSSAFAFLCTMAQQMSSTLSNSLDLPEVYRLWPKTLSESGRGLQLLLRGPLLRVERGRCTFAHELLMSFFAAEGLLRSTADIETVAARLEAARTRPLADLVVEAQPTGDAVRILLRHSPATWPLFEAIEAGGHGHTAKSVLHEELAAVLESCKQALTNAKAEICRQEVAETRRKILLARVEYSWHPNAYQDALLFFLGATAPPDRWLAPILSLIEQVDRFLSREAARISSVQHISAKAVERTLYNAALHIAGEGNITTRQLVHGFANRNGFGKPPVHCLGEWFQRAGELGPGVLQVLCNLGHRCDLDEVTRKQIADLLPTVIQAVWKSRWQNGRMEALVLAHYLAVGIDDPQRHDVLGTLESLDTENDPFLNSFWLEAMEAWGKELDPVMPPRTVLEEIHAVLANPDDEELQQRAHGMYCAQFEPLSAVSAPHDEAIESLGEQDRRRFLAVAALGARNGSVMFMGQCIQSMVTIPGAPGDPLVHRALERWTISPPEQMFFPQDETQAFLQAYAGLAFLALPYRAPEESATPRDWAWACFGELIYLATKTNSPSPPADLQIRVDRCWNALGTKLLAESVEPFLLLIDPFIWSWRYAPHVPRLGTVWPKQIGAHALRLLEKGDIEARGLFFDGIGTRLIRCAVAFGGAAARPRLAVLVEHPSLGHEAMAGLRRLDGQRE
jgi:transcriptional regulator with XRE-family HTH domain